MGDPVMESPQSYNFQNILAPFFIVLGNLVPLYGVIFWEWSLFDVFYLYWAENVMIGVFTALRMLLVAAAWGWVIFIGSLFHVAFFCVHYGMFTFGHGMILFEIFHDAGKDINNNEALLLGYIFTKSEVFLYALLGLLVSVAIKAIRDIREDRKEARTAQGIMFSPYGRIIILHVTIIFGGLGVQELGEPLWALGLLIVLKTLYDLAVLNGINILKKVKKV